MAGKSIDDKTLWKSQEDLSIEEQLVMGEVNPNYNPQDPFSNTWGKIVDYAIENGATKPEAHYGRTATEILKKEYPTIYAGYMAVMEEQLELFSKKHLDYGMSNISAGTSLSTKDEREFALSGLWYRMSDKINRWKNLIISSRQPNNETIIDTFQDICNYAIIAQLVEKDQWKK